MQFEIERGKIDQIVECCGLRVQTDSSWCSSLKFSYGDGSRVQLQAPWRTVKVAQCWRKSRFLPRTSTTCHEGNLNIGAEVDLDPRFMRRVDPASLAGRAEGVVNCDEE